VEDVGVISPPLRSPLLPDRRAAFSLASMNSACGNILLYIGMYSILEVDSMDYATFSADTTLSLFMDQDRGA
jgi:hypothetical protein